MSKKISARILIALSFVVFTPTSTKVNFEKVKNGTINVSQILCGICIIGAQFHKAYGLTKEIAYFCYHYRTVHCDDSPLALLMWLGSKIGFSIVGLGLLKEGLNGLFSKNNQSVQQNVQPVIQILKDNKLTLN